MKEEWGELLKDKEVILCFDNDSAGGKGMVKALKMVPHAKVMIIPDTAGAKDISDYVTMGGDLHALLRTARRYTSLESVMEDQIDRIAVFGNHTFHDEFIKEHTPRPVVEKKPRTNAMQDKVANAKAYPMTNLLEFGRDNKCKCPWHGEKTASLVYYPDTNHCYCFGCGKVADSIEAYMMLNGVGFVDAVNELNKI